MFGVTESAVLAESDGDSCITPLTVLEMEGVVVEVVVVGGLFHYFYYLLVL